MAELFRKDSLQKLSSTEQLDRMIPMIRPSFWLVLAGAAAALAAGLLWGLLSRLPVCVDAAGIVTQDSGAVICFVPLEEGKQVQAGMSVILGEEEREAQVTWVEPYVSSLEDLEALLGDGDLAAHFLEDGPVVAVACSLAGESALQPGALFSCSIVVEEKAPLAFLLPSLLSAPRGASR